MSNTKISAVICAATCLLVTSASSSAITEFEIKQVGRTPLTFDHPSKQTVRFEIVTTVAPKIEATDSNAFLQAIGRLFGREDEADSVIAGIRMTWGDHAPTMLSLSATADLYSPTSVKVANRGNNIVLSIRGGDGSGGYFAELEIAPYGMIERRVRHRISGYEEVTKYQHSERRIRAYAVEKPKLPASN